jgi:hypothetical protein
MKRIVGIAGGLLLLILLLAGGAFMVGRLLGAGLEGDRDGDGRMVQVTTEDGQVVEAELVRAEEVPDRPPDVVGVFERRLDNSIFVDETEGGLALAVGQDGSLSVVNATGKISEIVVTGETAVYVGKTLEELDETLVDGKLYQKVESGSMEEIGELSFVRGWGEMHGDRLVADVLLYVPPPVISR